MEAFALSADAPRVPLPHKLLSDDRLLRLIAAGNAQAFGTVYARYHAPLYAYCRSIVRDPDDAKDALQSTMMKALAALNGKPEREIALKPWLFRIAHNESISLLRKRKPEEELTDAVSPPVAGVDAEVVDRERLKQLVVDLQELPERQRGALLMREVNGLSYEEIAGALAISAGAARQTVFEARTALAEYSEGREVACDNIRRSISDGDGRALRARRVRAHLRACNGCRDFQTTLTTRRRDLALLTPALSGGGAVALLQAIVGTGAIAGSGSAIAGGAGLLGGSASAILGGAATKTVVAVVAATATGVGAVEIADKKQPERDAAVNRPVAAQVAQAAAAGVAASDPVESQRATDSGSSRAVTRGSKDGPNGFALIGPTGDEDHDRGDGGRGDDAGWSAQDVALEHGDGHRQDGGRGQESWAAQDTGGRRPGAGRRPPAAAQDEPWDDEEGAWEDDSEGWDDSEDDTDWAAVEDDPEPVLQAPRRPRVERPKAPPPPPVVEAPEPDIDEPYDDAPVEDQGWEDDGSSDDDVDWAAEERR